MDPCGPLGSLLHFTWGGRQHIAPSSILPAPSQPKRWEAEDCSHAVWPLWLCEAAEKQVDTRLERVTASRLAGAV